MATLAERLQQWLAGLNAFQQSQAELMTEIKQQFDTVVAKVHQGVGIAGIDDRIDAQLNREVGPWVTNVESGLAGFTAKTREELTSVVTKVQQESQAIKEWDKATGADLGTWAGSVKSEINELNQRTQGGIAGLDNRLADVEAWRTGLGGTGGGGEGPGRSSEGNGYGRQWKFGRWKGRRTLA